MGEEHPAVAVLLFGSSKIEPLRKIRVKWTKEAKNGYIIFSINRAV